MGVPISLLFREGTRAVLYFGAPSKLGRTDGEHFLNPGGSGGEQHTQLLRILLVWQWLWAKLLHFLQTQPHPQTFSGPKFLAQMFPATLTTFVPNMPLYGLKKIQDLGEEGKRGALLDKMIRISASHHHEGCVGLF